MITPRSYAKRLEKSENELSKKLRDYLRDPDEENVHDLRTSVRRVIATADILPRKIRRKTKSEERVGNYQKLLKLNARVRDMDIILSKIMTDEGENENSQLVKRLEETRQTELKAARKLAESIKDEDGFELRAEDLPGSPLRKRYSKVVEKLAERVDKRLRVVLKEPQNKEELHRLREDSRRLRYTLELDDKPDETERLKLLQSWQDILGAIHDTDIFTAYFDNSKGDAVNMESLIEREARGRNENYERFRSLARETPSFKSPN